MNKGKKLYEGKAKILYEGPEKGTAIQHFKDDATAFNNQKKTIVPHNENRAVIFNSNLFHETDNIKFKAGYENRRINVTLLFGRRGL